MGNEIKSYCVEVTVKMRVRGTSMEDAGTLAQKVVENGFGHMVGLGAGQFLDPDSKPPKFGVTICTGDIDD